MEYFENLEMKNPNKSWVIKELGKLIGEWETWCEFTKVIPDHEYNSNTQTIVFMDGEENIHKHEILVQKTVTFLTNNFVNFTFMIRSRNGQLYEGHDCRLQLNAKYRLNELKAIQNSIDYAVVPDSFWKQKGIQIVDKLADKSPEVAAELVTHYLKDPFAS